MLANWHFVHRHHKEVEEEMVMLPVCDFYAILLLSFVFLVISLFFLLYKITQLLTTVVPKTYKNISKKKIIKTSPVFNPGLTTCW